MPKESVIRKKVIDKLEKDGGICWFPAKVRYKKEIDIFGVWDVLSFFPKTSKFLFVQLTTASNIRAREKKVGKWIKAHKIKKFPGEVWGLKKDNTFKIIKICQQ